MARARLVLSDAALVLVQKYSSTVRRQGALAARFCASHPRHRTRRLPTLFRGSTPHFALRRAQPTIARQCTKRHAPGNAQQVPMTIHVRDTALPSTRRLSLLLALIPAAARVQEISPKAVRSRSRSPLSRSAVKTRPAQDAHVSVPLGCCEYRPV